MRWRSFCKLIVDLAEALGTQMVVTLGALLADVPHSRPVPITGLSSDEGLVQRVGLSPSSYEGPTGIVGVLHCRLPGGRRADRLAVGLGAALRGRRPNPKAALALVRKLEGLVGVSVDAGELESAAADYERQVSLAVRATPTCRPSSSASSRPPRRRSRR
jgi:predicted ATP-grasp superfamily ATP-dependent carboligase